MLIPNSSPESPQVGVFRRRRGQAGAAAAEQVGAVALDLGQRAAQLHRQSSESVIRYQEVRSRADHSYRGADFFCPGEQGDQLVLGRGAGEIVGGAAGADRGEAGERVVAAPRRQGARVTLLSRTAGGSFRVTRYSRHQALPQLEDVAGADRDQDRALRAVAWMRRSRKASARAAVGSQATRFSVCRIGGGSGYVEAADAGEGADRFLAGGVDVEDGDLVGQGQGGAELGGEDLGAGVEVGLEDGDQARRARVRAGPRGRRGPRSGGGRSRRRCGPRPARP